MEKQTILSKKYYNIITIILGVLILIGGLIAGGSLLKSDSTISISKDYLDTLKTKGINNININSSPILCDDSQCWSDVKQEGLMQTQFRTQKSYCSNSNKVFNNQTKLNETICISFTDYTKEELTNQRDEFVKQRINDYVGNIKSIEEKTPIITQIDDGGIITTSKWKCLVKNAIEDLTP